MPKQGLSREDILRIARSRGGHFTVDRFTWGGHNLRKKCRKMTREGLLIFDGIRHDEVCYRLPKVTEP